MQIEIGVAHTPQDLDLDVENAETVVTEFETALVEGRPLLRIQEKDGRRHVIVVDKIVYFGYETEEHPKGVGFSSE